MFQIAILRNNVVINCDLLPAEVCRTDTGYATATGNEARVLEVSSDVDVRDRRVVDD
jgi:hypothetical protein